MNENNYKKYRKKKVKIAYAGAWILLGIAFILGVILGSVITNIVVSAHTDETPGSNPYAPFENKLVYEMCVAENTDYTALYDVKLTAYCKENYPHICNDGDSSRTASGTIPTVGKTVAVDPKVIPYGSEVIINGHTYIAEDCGQAVKGNRVDILFETHAEALDFGVQYAEVIYVAK